MIGEKLNLTLVSYSSQNASYPAPNAFDGSTSSYWRAGSTTYPQTLVFELDNFYYLTGFRIYPSTSNYRVNSFKIFVSSDEVSFTQVCANMCSSTNAFLDCEFPSTELAKYVKIEFTGASTSRLYVYEFELYGTLEYKEDNNSGRLLSDSLLDLNNWTKNMTSFPVFTNTYENGVNTLQYQGGAEFERIYIPITVKKNKKYKFKFKMHSPTGFQMGGYGNDYAFAFIRASAPNTTGDALSAVNLAYSENWDTSASDVPKQYTISFNSGDYTTVYVAFDFGYIIDGITSTYVFSDFRLDNGVEDPSEYLKYVESDGTQYINLDYTHTANTKIELSCRVIQNTQRGYEALFGSRYQSYQKNAFVFFTRFGSNDVPVYSRSGAETQGSNFIYGKDITLVCYQKLATWTTKDGTSYSITTNGTANDGKASLLLFDLNNAQSANQINPDTSRSVLRVYSLKIYENDTLVRHYKPALDSSGIAYLFEETENEAYYPAIGNTLNFLRDDGRYLVRSESKIYSTKNNELTLLESSWPNSDLFKLHGSKEIPEWSYISQLINPEVLYWQSSVDNVPEFKVSMTATPIAQNIITNAIDLSDPSITGIELMTVNCDGNPLIAVSFDDKQTWHAWNGTEWSLVSEEFSGMTKELAESVNYDQWMLLYEGASSFYIKVSLTTLEDKLTEIYVDFAN